MSAADKAQPPKLWPYLLAALTAPIILTQNTPMYFAVPVFNAEPPILEPSNADQPHAPLPGLAGGAESSGMAWHLFLVGPRRFDEHPDRILDDAFAFFDANPDVPLPAFAARPRVLTIHATGLMNRLV